LDFVVVTYFLDVYSVCFSINFIDELKISTQIFVNNLQYILGKIGTTASHLVTLTSGVLQYGAPKNSTRYWRRHYTRKVRSVACCFSQRIAGYVFGALVSAVTLHQGKLFKFMYYFRVLLCRKV
jgi:hypothetical protein